MRAASLVPSENRRFFTHLCSLTMLYDFIAQLRWALAVTTSCNCRMTNTEGECVQYMSSNQNCITGETTVKLHFNILQNYYCIDHSSAAVYSPHSLPPSGMCSSRKTKQKRYNPFG